MKLPTRSNWGRATRLLLSCNGRKGKHTGASRSALSPCGRGHRRRRRHTQFGEGLLQRIHLCPLRETPHPTACGCHLLPQAEKGRGRSEFLHAVHLKDNTT